MYILYQTVRSPIWDALTSIEFSVSGCMCVCVCRPVWVCTKMEAIYLRVHSISHDVELYIGIAWTTLISWFVIMCTKLISTQSEPVFRVRKIETLTYIPCSFSQSLSLSRSRLYKKKTATTKKQICMSNWASEKYQAMHLSEAILTVHCTLGSPAINVQR